MWCISHADINFYFLSVFYTKMSCFLSLGSQGVVTLLPFTMGSPDSWRFHQLLVHHGWLMTPQLHTIPVFVSDSLLICTILHYGQQEEIHRSLYDSIKKQALAGGHHTRMLTWAPTHNTWRQHPQYLFKRWGYTTIPWSLESRTEDFMLGKGNI